MSAIPAIRRWLRDALKDDAAFSKLYVSYGYDDADVSSFAVVGGPDPEDTEWVALGDDRQDYYFSIEILLQIYDRGQNAEEADDDVDKLYDAVRAIVKADPTIGGLLLTPAKVQIAEWLSAPGDEGYGARVRLRIRCRTRS